MRHYRPSVYKQRCEQTVKLVRMRGVDERNHAAYFTHTRHLMFTQSCQ